MSNGTGVDYGREYPDPDEELDLPPGVPVADPAMYHGILGEITLAAAPHTEADPVGILASLMNGVSVLIGGEPHYRIAHTRHPLLVWPLLFGRTGSGRKGEADETARVFLNALKDPRLPYPLLRVSGLSSGEGLIERIRDQDLEGKEPVGTEDKRLIVVEPEFASVMARTKGDGSTLGPVLREAWMGGRLTKLNRKTYGASWSHIGITGHVTPSEFRTRLADGEMSGGTYNRFLPLWVERSRKIAIPEGAPDEVVDALASQLRQAILAASGYGRIQLGRGARPLWTDELYEEFTEADDEDRPWTEFARRAAPYCLRVGALHAALADRNLIDVDDLAAAGALVRYSIASAKYVLGPRRDPRYDRIVRAIEGAGGPGLTRTQISGLFSRNLNRKVLTDLLDEAVRVAAIETRIIPTAGRPATVYVSTKKTK